MNMNIKGHAAQLDFADCRDVPFIGFVGGRGAGKSCAASMRLIRWGLLEPGLYGMLAPTYPLLHDSILRSFTQLAKPAIRRQWGNPTNIELRNGTEILCRSLDDPERARGPSYRGVVWDEASLCHREAFDIVIACLRYEGKQGWLACTFTPKGPSHWTAEIFNSQDRPDVKCFHCPTSGNPFNPPGFANTLRRQYTSMFAQQEIDGRFVSLSGGMFKRQWFKVIDKAPADMDVLARFWDLAATVQKSEAHDPDYTAGGLLGLKDGQWFIMDMRRIRESPKGVEDLIRQTAVIDPEGTIVCMEQEGGASGKTVTDHYARSVLVGFDFHGIHPNRDKMLRAMPLAAAAERGDVFIVKGPWNSALLDELESFSPDCDHDDQVDACSGAFNDIAKRYNYPNVWAINSQNTPKGRMIAKIEEEVDKLMQELTPEERLLADSLFNGGDGRTGPHGP